MYPAKFENKDFFTNVLIPLQNKLYLHLGEKDIKLCSQYLNDAHQIFLAGFE